ncbi:hypothetical protein M2273_002786 [Mucilaginibacter lappiensis]
MKIKIPSSPNLLKRLSKLGDEGIKAIEFVFYTHYLNV